MLTNRKVFLYTQLFSLLYSHSAINRYWGFVTSPNKNVRLLLRRSKRRALRASTRFMSRRSALSPIPIDPLAAPVFKSLFGTEANKDILLSFVNTVLLHISAPSAVTLELVQPRNVPKRWIILGTQAGRIHSTAQGPARTSRGFRLPLSSARRQTAEPLSCACRHRIEKLD